MELMNKAIAKSLSLSAILSEAYRFVLRMSSYQFAQPEQQQQAIPNYFP
jgi:hypothetical protein